MGNQSFTQTLWRFLGLADYVPYKYVSLMNNDDLVDRYIANVQTNAQNVNLGTAPGVKLDTGKIPVRRGLLEYFPRACLAVAEVSMKGATKYCWNGWESVDDGVNRYGDAEVRHICQAAIAKDHKAIDPELQVLHAAEEAWNAMARLELLIRELNNGAV